MTMSDDVSIDEVRALVRVQLGAPMVTADDRLVEDLGAESIDVLNVAVAVEDRYDVSIAEERLAALVRVSDLCDEICRLRRQG